MARDGRSRVTDQRDPEQSLALQFEAIEQTMRRRSDERIKLAKKIMVCRLAGITKRDEILERTAMTAEEFDWAWRKLQDAMRAETEDHAAA